ncbi:MAG: CHAT domain-containing protein [Planctomycetota bacterium]|nr:MAG: CHAT domain-containing protein [Planctomycetota bacterium]
MRREYEVHGRVLQIHLGDITRLEVGAIVNSENSDLIMAAPQSPSVSGAIRRAEGEAIAEELARLGPVEPGRAVVTPARALPCRWILHAATVVRTERGHRSSLDILRRAVRSSLSLAAGLGVDSVAFPAFGVRATAISRREASQAMVEEIVEALAEPSPLRRVVIALLDTEAFLAFFEEALRRAAAASAPLCLRAARRSGALEWSVDEDVPVERSLRVPLAAGRLDDLRAALRELHSAAERRLKDEAARLDALGREVAALVPEPLRDRAWSEGRPVRLRLDEDLAWVPFELALHERTRWIERCALARRLVTRRTPPHGIAAAGDGAGPPRRALFAAGPLAALPGAARELDELAELFWRRARRRTRATVLADGRTTRDALLAELDAAELVHWCGHTDAEGVWELAGGGLLPADLCARSPSRARLVLLNSCGGPRAHEQAGAFLLAGARNVVLTHWEVRDDFARRFARRFYEELLLGRELGAALATARESLREADELHWAAYAHYGAPGERIYEPAGISPAGDPTPSPAPA